MKKICLATLVLLSILMPELNAQFIVRQDSVKVYENMNLVASVTGRAPQSEDAQEETVALIKDFVDNLKQIKDQIPDYQDYTIIYEQNARLRVVEKSLDLSVFIAKDGEFISSFSKKAELRSENFKVNLFFEEINDLIEKDYSEMLLEAMRDAKRHEVVEFWRPAVLHNYSFDERRELKDKEINPREKARFVIVGNAAIGVYKNKPQYEYGLGVGFTFGNKGKQMLYFMSNTIFQYNDETKLSEGLDLISIHYKPSKIASIEIGFPLGSGPFDRRIENYGVRLASTFYPINGIYLRPSFNYVFVDSDLELNFGFSVGYGF